MPTDSRFNIAIAQIDAANAQDPAGKELLYSQRMSIWLDRIEPNASDALRLAARAQHIRRWIIPRRDYPMDRIGYLKWRTTLYKFHAEEVSKILTEVGYDQPTVARVAALVRKERIKTDPEAQILEDVICLVFLENYFADFAASHEDEKVIGILRKTWKKMSERGRELALTLQIPAAAMRLLERALLTILCIGTTPTMQRTMVFDRLVIDDVNRAVEAHEHASGKSVNVARVLRVLGREAFAMGFAGGRRGESLLEDMDAARIRHDFVRTARQTRLCTTVIDRSTGQATELVEEAPAASAAEWDELIGKIDARVGAAKAVVFSGTLAAGAPVDFCDRWIGKAPLVVVDAKGEAMRRALRSRGRVIAKLNRRELGETIGEKLETDGQLFDAMRRVAPAEGWLIVTLGAAGAAAWIGGDLMRIAAPAVRAISAIGSGDAFTAGLLAAYDDTPENALKLACACGAANALTPFSGQVRREDVERLVGLVTVESIG